ncbi:hypothetical protein M4D55_07205 [Metabacillus idriensis]|uniref:Uncharacterized protein n=1 Tax=Metabacillus idriensis TaxID=324768 RepID=A0A6I2M4A1_9BACI|nr:hypothetical protein [Metabacillus idriensis]MCM3595581.1 hypothetical protein [Metabacillus idriensis]MRX52397.1 hypothetical protein [Metabacillus idriensis]OHR65025.1 hypothetical protein HMPREF3291_13290 [Bacillus sp. HMSC76G11]
MKAIFRFTATAACLLMISRHFGVSFASQYYWWLAALFLGSLTGNMICHLIEKNKLKHTGTS